MTSAVPALPQALVHTPHHSHCTLITFGPWPHYLTLPYINCINHLPACNPDKSKSLWMSLFCSSAPPTSPALFYVISIFQALLKLHPARGHCTHFNSSPPAHQCFNSFLIYLSCLLSEPNSINKSWNSNTHTHVWIMHTNTHQGTEDNCYGLDHSSNIWQLIGKGAHSHEFLYLDFCLTPVVVWLLETKWIGIASEIPWKRLGQGISAFLVPSH